MFRLGFGGSPRMMGFPRVRGDVPSGAWVTSPKFGFSPRARGCSAMGLVQRKRALVFPACAGMFLNEHTPPNTNTRFPRVRGDVPRGRGCEISHSLVFPACAGMFRTTHLVGQVQLSFPRVRGDVPVRRSVLTGVAMFSPRARGCSAPGR